MSFALTGTHIDGGTFNNVSSNMSQVFNSNVVHIAVGGADPHDGTTGNLLDSTTTGRTIGTIRPQHSSRDQRFQPYVPTIVTLEWSQLP
ncbi:hypothetical protein FB451DRAFT_1398333 [Mycena latifolia]|nr:hypothetical protein FB451DRAFT_1398333 [Mycena latifolia]